MKIVYFKAYFGEIWAKLAIIYESLTLELFILINFKENVGFLWPFFIFEDLALFETAYCQIKI